jgi:hypothetical protein
MKPARILVLCSVAGAALASVLAACSGDDTVVSNKDASTDSGGDGTTPTADGSTPDGGGDLDGSNPVDGSGGDAGALSVQQFMNAQAAVLCDRSSFCCGQLDAGPINSAKCNALFAQYGFEDHAFPIQDLLNSDGGAKNNIVVNQTAAQDCLSALKLAACSLGATLHDSILTSCTTALDGTLAQGAPCTATLECKQPGYCKFPDGGTTGTCSPIEAVGGPCDKIASAENSPILAGQEACSARRYGSTLNFCDTSNQNDAGASTCQPANGEGSPCVTTNYCQSNLMCDPDTGKCAKVASFITSDFCTFLH